jgi:Cu+-exporting ATPase
VYGEEEIISCAAAVEDQSEHAVAEAVVQAARDRGIVWEEAQSFVSETGLGVAGQVGRRRIRVGSAKYMERHGVPLGTDAVSADWDALGFTTIFVSCDDRAVGRIAIADRVRPNAEQAVRTLRELGLSVLILSGDREAAVAETASQIGIDRVVSGVRPHEKTDVIQRMQERGETVLMVGDGINDAPALAQADVGMAVVSGTRIAIEASDVTLMHADLSLVPEAIRISRGTMRVIRQNLFFAFIYNIICIPVAAGILYPFFGVTLSPVIASAAMALSSVSVVSNSLRLRRFK